MGSNVPLGYDASERTLVINLAEAKTVRHVFALYRELGCVRRVKDEADRLGLRTKPNTNWFTNQAVPDTDRRQTPATKAECDEQNKTVVAGPPKVVIGKGETCP
jgi:hypothetical protein